MPIGAAEPEWRALRRLEERFGPELRRRIERALAALREAPLSNLALAYLERGDIQGVIDAMPWLVLGIDLDREVKAILLLAREAGARIGQRYRVQKAGPAVGRRPGALQVAPRPGAVNPAALRATGRQIADLVTGVTDETKAAIRELIERGRREGVTVRETARDIRQLVGLNRPQTVALQNYRAGLEAQGLSPARIERLVAQRTAKGIRYRAEVISRTETLRAANDGTRAEWQQAIADGTLNRDVRQVWVASADACPICRALDGRAVTVGSAFTSSIHTRGPGQAAIVTRTVDGPPQHPNCRCAVSLEVEAA